MSSSKSTMCPDGEALSLFAEVEGQMRIGPSFCMQNALIDPLVLVVLCCIAFFRAKELLPLAGGNPRPRFDGLLGKIQLGGLIVGILKSLVFLFQGASSSATIYAMCELLKFAIVLAMIFLEGYKEVQRGSVVKAFWIIDFCYNLMRIRFNLVYLAFSEETPDRVIGDFFSFALATTIMMAGLLEKPIPNKTGANTFHKVEMDGTVDFSHEKTFAGRGEGAASWWSLMLFNWMTELLVKGKAQQLNDADLFPLLEEDTTFDSGVRLTEHWQKQIDPKNEADPSLFKALVGCFGSAFAVAGCWKALNDLVVFIGPLLLQSLIRFVEDSSEDKSALDGAMLAIGIFLSKMIETIALGQYFQRGYRVGGQVRSSLTHLIYRKSFMMSSKGRQQYKLGEMVSLMSVDAQRLCGVAPYLHQFWSAPIQLFVSVGLLYNIVGPSVFAGMMLMVLLIPVNTWIAQKQTVLNRQIMKIKDERANTMDEVLQGIRIIKYFAWEKSFVDKVQEIRSREMALVWKNGLWGIASMFLWGGSPMLVAMITFVVYSWSGQDLKPSVAFTALALFNVMRFPLNTLPMIINFIVEGRTALTRLCNYLLADEVDPKYYHNCGSIVTKTHMARQSDPNKAISISDARFSWAKAIEKPPPPPKENLNILQKIMLPFQKQPPPPQSAAFSVILRDISLEVTPGQLCMVCGPVGSGKSSLLGAILGDMKKESGDVELHGRVSYVAQQPWIVNATLKENILFGAKYDEDKYNKVIDVCALRRDLEMLPAGDSTEIGEKGINLSGGQKARVSLARAVYQDSDVYLLDDPLSAVDVHVSKVLFEDCIKTYLAGKTILLVTHQIQYLPRADHVMVIDQGRITGDGSFEEVSRLHPHLAQEILPRGQSSSQGDADSVKGSDKGASQKKPAMAKTVSSVSTGKGKTTTTETRSKGTVKVGVWVLYARAMGLAVSAYLIGSYVFSQGLQLSSDWSLSSWSGAVAAYDSDYAEAVETGGEMPQEVSTSFYLSIYAMLTLFAAASVAVRGYFCTLGTIRSAIILHDNMLATVMRAPVKFFDTTPTGRVLNRFSSDQYTADNELRQTIQMLLLCFIRVLTVGFVILYVTPIFIVCVLPLGFVYYHVQRFYRQSSREMKRLESVAKSPVFAEFSETLTGISTIRAFNKQGDFSDTCFRLNDTFSRAYYCNNAANRWLGIRLEFIGNIAVGASALFAVLAAGDPGAAGMVGLSITYALEVTGMLNWLIRTFTQMESYMVAIERIDEYSKMDVEAAASVEGQRPPDSWPHAGVLTFDDVWMRYREELDPALRGISFATEAGEKIGIVGRTGAGKSSLAVALFRMTEIHKGEVRLDGVNVAKIGLDDLRSRMSIIPQDPILFAGTIRSNLDPFNDYRDSDLWDVLDKVHLKTFVESQGKSGLLYDVQEGGQNLSVGQRQLMCMARALLRKAKVIVMDEATASVDMQTDAAIQDTIREQFKQSTVLTIAHRLDTVLACDRVMVLGEGRVLEIGVPRQLMADASSTFHQMTADSHAVEEMLG